MEDQVTFSSEKTEGQYIHTSGRVFRQVGISLHENWLDHQELIYILCISSNVSIAMRSMLQQRNQDTLSSLIIVQCPMKKILLR